MKKNILITGANGFIGSRLIAYLRRTMPEYRIVATDLSVGSGHDYVSCDILKPHDLEDVFEKYNNSFEFVIHLAAEISRLNGEEHPVKMVETNTIGTLNVIKQCLRHKSKLINFSTSEVYGNLLVEKDIVHSDDLESLSAFKLTNVYGMSKYFAETLVKHYVENYGLKAVSIRPCMVYGAGIQPSKYKSALDRFVHGALSGKGFEVHKGSERSWCHIRDFIEGVKCVVAKHIFRKGVYAAYDIGVDDFRKMRDLGSMVIKMTNTSPRLMKVIDAPRFLSVRKRMDFTPIKKLGFKPTLKIEDGLRELIDWHKQLIRNNHNEI